jgi:hypothetical protein
MTVESVTTRPRKHGNHCIAIVCAGQTVQDEINSVIDKENCFSSEEFVPNPMSDIRIFGVSAQTNHITQMNMEHNSIETFHVA